MKRIAIPLLLLSMLPGCSSDAPSSPPRTQRRALVKLAVSKQQDMPHVIEAVASVEPSATVTVVSRTSGVLEKVLIEDGARVSEGQLLFQIEKKPYEIALHQVQARLESERAKLSKARDDYSRAQKMIRGGFSSTAEADASKVALVSAQAAVRESEASLEKALLDLSYCEARAPMSGKTGEIRVDRGNVIPAQTQLVTIRTTSPCDVTFSVPEKYLPIIREKSAAGELIASASAKDGSSVSGSVYFSDDVDPHTGTIRLKASFSNTEELLWPGEFLRVRLLLGTRKNAIIVPSRSVMLGPDGPFVYVVGDDLTARIRLVSTDIEDNGYTMVTQGISPGESVVLEGHVRLKNGMPVTVSNGQAKHSSGKPGGERRP